jgi:2-keto-4-pentenoate hydratase
MVEQLRGRREAIAAGARHVGWKLGVGERERIGGSLAVGYLTSATCVEAGTEWRAGLVSDLRFDVELAVELGDDVPRGASEVSVAGYATALELVDLAPVLEDAVSVLATNVFHRAVAFGAFGALRAEAEGVARVDGETRARAPVEDVVTERLLAAARVLEAVGERLRAGDLVITGSVVQVAFAAPAALEAEITGLAPVRLGVEP